MEHHNADTLDLDAEVVRSHLDQVIEWVAARTPPQPRVIADVGAGTGTGTLALAHRFPTAELIAIDQSPVMLDRLASVAPADRVRIVPADLDATWPAAADGLDLAWAASSLHHLREPDRLLAALHGAVNPGGLLAVVEMDGLPRFLPEDIGIGRPGLEGRCRALAARLGWNSYPNWTKHLERAGFAEVEEQDFDYNVHPAPPAARRYALKVLGGLRHRLGGQLEQDDLDTLDLLLAPDGPASVLRRDDLVVHGSRTVWTARRM
ncbi:class I SAM-dependent methyltransferase [Catenulispora subtropica]|uniref:Methyltransferase domain-containing protein n=1 Tax=Catenulispora subtropica TaxID=450798 RepID=A0ABN2S5L1_9ACTN